MLAREDFETRLVPRPEVEMWGSPGQFNLNVHLARSWRLVSGRRSES
jgi:hypothetical protein